METIPYRIPHGHMAIIYAITSPMHIGVCISPNSARPPAASLDRWLTTESASDHHILSNPTLTILERFYLLDTPEKRERLQTRLVWHRAHPPRWLDRRYAAPNSSAAYSPYPEHKSKPWVVFYILHAEPGVLRSKTTKPATTRKAALDEFLREYPVDVARTVDAMQGTTTSSKVYARRRELTRILGL